MLEANPIFEIGTMNAHLFLSEVAFIAKNKVLESEFYFGIGTIPD